MLPACSNGAAEAIPALERGTPVILISIDTLRSDRLPAYGYSGVATPAIDRLRRDSTLFEHAYSHVGLTLPSHASIFTGLRPFEHGVRDNVGYRFTPRTATLAEVLADAGYATGGFVSAYVLRRATGIGAGFEVWDDEVPVILGRELGALQRPGPETLDRALAWIDSVRDRPFFLFLHLYEPHTPYAPAAPFAELYRDRPYDGEIAAADAVVGRLLERLESLGLYDRSLVVLLSDHGEGLGDHGEQEHEILIYRETLQVPLLVKLPRQARAGDSVRTPAQLADVAPTLYRLLRVEPPSGLAGASLFELPTDPPRDILSESLYPRIHLGWSELVSVIRGDLHLIEGPDVELYDLASDPAETRRLEAEPIPELRPMRRVAADYDRNPAPPAAVDEETRRALAALGYLSSSPGAAASEGPRADPKTKIGLLGTIGEASRRLAVGDFETAAQSYRELTRSEPGMVFAWEQLGRAERGLGRTDAAVAAYRRALELSGGAPEIFLSLAELYLDLGRLDEAIAHAERALPYHETAHDLLAQAALRQNDLERAERHLQDALATRGTRVSPLITLAELRVRRQDYEGALAAAEQAESEFGDREDRLLLRGLALQKGHALTALGRLAEAQAAYRAEIELAPDELKAYSFLSFAYAVDNRSSEAAAALRSMVDDNPTPAAHAEAVRALRALGDPDAAARWLAAARRRWPQAPELRDL